MSGNVDDQNEESTRATAPSCSTVKQEQTSPTAGEPAVSSGMKSACPTSTKKAWRQRLEMDVALAAASAALPTLPPSTSSAEEKPISDASGRVSSQLHQSQLFVCRHCGKYFITLKYLEMHTALHTGQPLSKDSHIQPPISTRSQVRCQPPAIAPRSAAGLNPALPTPASFPSRGLPVLLPPTTTASSAPPRYRDWTCDICQKKFSQNSSYKNHQRTHSDERPYVCTICSIGFKERYHLKKHTLFKHSSETREQCRFCSKCFKDSTAVRAHERIHSDARPYACRRCSKAFKTSECLWHHENRSKSCGGVAKQHQQVPAVDDTVRRRSRKRGRPSAQQLPGPPQLTQPPPLSVGRPFSTNTSSLISILTETKSGITSASFGFPSVQGPAVSVNSSGLSAARFPTSICTVNSITTPITSLSGSKGNPAVRPPGRFDGDVGRQTEPLITTAAAGSSHREGLVLLANCAVSRPSDVTSPTQVKVEPEVVLADYELTAMNLPEESFYERKRMAADETTSSVQTPSTVNNLYVAPLMTHSSRSLVKDIGPLILATGRVECCQCGRQFATIAAYNKHVSQVHRFATTHQS